MYSSLSMLLCSLLSLCILVEAGSFTPLRPPAIPLAVKSPYLSTWLKAGVDGGNGGYLAGTWPVHWSDKVTGWEGLIRVDGKTWQWMGWANYPAVNQTSLTWTSTQSVFTMNVDNKVELVINFLSPITPKDYKRQSLVASYMEVKARSIDGRTHNVQIYSDITAEWASGERNVPAQWDDGDVGNLKYLKVWRQQQLQFAESGNDGNGMASWGDVYYTTDKTDEMTYQAAADTIARSTFANNGQLPNTVDSRYRNIDDNWPVFAFAKDFGKLGGVQKRALFSIGLYQDNAAQFVGSNGLQVLKSYWKTFWDKASDAVAFFHNDFITSSILSKALDVQVQSDSVAVAGQDYATITSLAVRQAFGSTQFVGTKDKLFFFCKEISSDGNTQTVDVIFPMHPLLNYFNPDLLKMLLDPLFENQESGHYPNKYSMHDLGSNYPNATGHPDGKDEEMPVEECGDMLVMTLAYAQKAKDNSYLQKHYSILAQWTSYLVTDSLIPATQLSTDDFAGRLQNQTNLALKGIIGIKAMSAIAQLVGKQSDSAKYDAIAKDYINKWQGYGIAKDQNPPHTTLNYGDSSSHGLLYNLWADLELNLNLVPKSVYKMQDKFYPTVKQRFGVPLDTRHSYTKTDWEIYAAASVSPATRDIFIKDIVSWLQATTTSRPWSDLYDTIDGGYGRNPDGPVTFVARPVMGGVFALLVARPNFPF
ncbi:DUF1793-domain-containing protein [Microthyrium microscopicum]|uniref:DUF1793-domain-containing protein n=1 Tax=Microthyrium microscopicum TaxID=703497 RepID=A0A6A6UVZ7_9PEZI|nr:DUF1793-domain-containing protein [Microthyrium microscopicum]